MARMRANALLYAVILAFILRALVNGFLLLLSIIILQLPYYFTLEYLLQSLALYFKIICT